MSERLTDVELDEAMDIAKSLHSLRLVAALAELKERRAADLSPEEVEALEWLLARFTMMEEWDVSHAWRSMHPRARAVLSRLTKAGR